MIELDIMRRISSILNEYLRSITRLVDEASFWIDILVLISPFAQGMMIRKS